MKLHWKRVISFLLSITLLAGLACAFAAAAEAHTVCLILRTTSDFAGQTAAEEVAAGDSFYLCLDIANNPTASVWDSVVAYDLCIRYDLDMVNAPGGADCFDGLSSPVFNESIADGVMHLRWTDSDGLQDETNTLQSKGTLAVVEFTAARALSAVDLKSCFTVLDTPVNGIITQFANWNRQPYDYLVAPGLIVTVGNTEEKLYNSSEADAFKEFLTVQKIGGSGTLTTLGKDEYSVEKGGYSGGLQTLRITANDDRTLTRTVTVYVAEDGVERLVVHVRDGALFTVFDSIGAVKSNLAVEAVYAGMRTETLSDYEITSAAVGRDSATGGEVLTKAGEQAITVSCGNQSEEVTIHIAKKSLTDPYVKVLPDTAVYTGQAHEPAFTVWESGVDGARQLQPSDYRYEYVDNVGVGTGTVRVTPEENGNYTFGEAVGTFIITQAHQDGLTIGDMPDTPTYGSGPFTVTVTGGDGNGLYDLTSSNESVLSVTNNSNSAGGSTWTVAVVGAGSATLTAGKAADAAGNFGPAALEREITVARRTITSVTWVGTEPRTYNKTPSNVTATADGVKAGDTVAVTVTGGKETNAGTYTATAADLDQASKANYELAGGLSATYVIHTAPIRAVTIASVDAKTYDGSTAGGGALAVTSDVTGAQVGAVGTFTWTDARAGTATVTVSDIELTGEDAANFDLPEDMRSIPSTAAGTAIAKATVTPLAVPALSVLSREAVGADAREYTYSLGSITFPQDTGARTYLRITPSGSLTAEESGGNLKITVPAAKAAGQTDTVQLTIESENCTDTTVEITLNYVNKSTVTVTLADAAITYGGSYTPSAVCAQAKPSGRWTYTYAAKEGGALDAGGRPRDAGTYTVTARYEDDVPVNGTPGQIGSAVATLTVAPRALTVNDGTMAITKAFDGETALPAGVHVNALGLSGVLAADKGKVELTQEAGKTPVYEDAAVGKNKRVIFEGLRLTGERSANYTLGTSYTFQRAEITKALPTVAQVAGDTAFAAAAYDGEAKGVTGVAKASAAGLGEMTVRYKPTGADESAGFVTPVNAGTYDVYASFQEGANFSAADVRLTNPFTVFQASRDLAVEKNALTLIPGALSGALGVTFLDRDNSAVLTYTLSGDVTAVNRSQDTFTAARNGSATVKLNIPATANYLAADEITVTVTAWPNPAEGLTVAGAAGDKVAYSVSGTAITVRGLKAADSTLRYTFSDGRTATEAGGRLTIRAGDGVILAEYTVADHTTVPPAMEGGATLRLETDATTGSVAKAIPAELGVDDALVADPANRLSGALEAASQALSQEAARVSGNTEIGERIEGAAVIDVRVSLEITATDAKRTDTETSYTVDLRPKYEIVASGTDRTDPAATAEVVLKEKSALPNTMLGGGYITVSVKLPDYLAAALTGGKQLYVDRIDSSGRVTERFRAALNADRTVTSWQVTEFSTFRLYAGNTVTVTFMRDNGVTETVSYDPTMIGQALPTDSKSGSTFNGWTIGGLSDLRTVTQGLLDLSGNQDATSAFKENSGGGNQPGGNAPGGSSGRSDSAAVNVSGSSRDHGTVHLSSDGARGGETVTITVRPDDGYEVDEVTVITSSGGTVSVYAEGNGRYRFIMPEGAVKVEVTYRRIGKTAARSFADVSGSYWAKDAIRWVSDSGYMIGRSSETFDPESQVTRQQLWMILARMAGADPADFGAAKAWAVNSGISDGGVPGSPVTRQQMAVILYRYARLMGDPTSGGVSLVSFPDSGAVAAYAWDALSWSVGSGIVGETADGRLDPGGTTTRAQFAVILWRFCGNAAR